MEPMSYGDGMLVTLGCNGLPVDLFSTQQTPNPLQALTLKLPGVGDLAISPCGCFAWLEKRSVYGIIVHLNDYHEASREFIADWLDAQQDAGKINTDFKGGIT